MTGNGLPIRVRDAVSITKAFPGNPSVPSSSIKRISFPLGLNVTAHTPAGGWASVAITRLDWTSIRWASPVVRGSTPTDGTGPNTSAVANSRPSGENAPPTGRPSVTWIGGLGELLPRAQNRTVPSAYSAAISPVGLTAMKVTVSLVGTVARCQELLAKIIQMSLMSQPITFSSRELVYRELLSALNTAPVTGAV